MNQKILFCLGPSRAAMALNLTLGIVSGVFVDIYSFSKTHL